MNTEYVCQNLEVVAQEVVAEELVQLKKVHYQQELFLAGC